MVGGGAAVAKKLRIHISSVPMHNSVSEPVFAQGIHRPPLNLTSSVFAVVPVKWRDGPREVPACSPSHREEAN